MKTNSERPAFPVEIDSRGEGVQTGIESGMSTGLSKREYFALMLTEKKSASYKPKNIIEWVKWALGMSYKGCERPYNEMAQRGIELADELLKQLES